MPLYYQCRRQPPHYLSCPDGRVLRGGFQCVAPHGGGVKQCGQGLLPPVKALPFGVDKKRIISLEDKYTKVDPVTLPPSLPSPTTPLSGGSLIPGPTPLTFPSLSSGGSSSLSSSSSSVQYHYQCQNSFQKHQWVTKSRIDRPTEALCPGKTMFGPSCNQPLVHLPSPMFGQTYTPLDASTVQSRAVVTTHVFASPSIPSSSFDLQPVRAEARSQRDLTLILMKSGQVSFLCRDGAFRKAPEKESSSRAANEYVEEPGLSALGFLKFQSGMSDIAFVVGRLEVKDLQGKGRFSFNPFISGTVTYPDFVVSQGEFTYAVELKTPRTSTMAAYLESGFYDSKDSFWKSRSVLEEIEARTKCLPEGWHQMLAFDLFNLTEKLDGTVAALQSEIRDGSQSAFWVKIKGFLFIEGNGTVTTFSKDKLLEYGGPQKTLGFTLVKGFQLGSSNQRDEDESAAAIVAKVNRGVPLIPTERSYLRGKLQAMRIPDIDDYIPDVLRRMSALERLGLERKL